MGLLPDQIVKLAALPSSHLNYALFLVSFGEAYDYGEKGKAAYNYRSGFQWDSERFNLLLSANPSGILQAHLVEK